MKCPWQVSTKEHYDYFTDEKNSYQVKVVDTEFRECIRRECPFWVAEEGDVIYEDTGNCIRPHGNV